MPTLWTDLTPEQQADLLRRKQRGERVVDLAMEIGIPYSSLRRSLNELNRLEEGAFKDEDEAGFTPEFDGSDTFSVTGDENNISINYTGERILSLEQLLAACGVNQEEWEVERYIVNKWEVGAKAEFKDLTWTNGVIDGEVRSTGGLTIEPLIQVKAWLVRKNPVMVTPHVQPLEVTVAGSAKLPAPSDKQGRTALVLPDMQIGFLRDPITGNLEPIHDRKALGVILGLLAMDAFDDIVILGDALDLADWSDKFIRSPEFTFTTQPALVELGWILGQIRRLQPGATIYYIEGNHEERMRRAVISNMAASYNLKPITELHLEPSMSIPRLLSLDSLDITWVGGYPGNEVWLNDYLRCVHGDRARGNPVDTARAFVQDSNVSTVFGHIHRIERASKKVVERGGTRTITALSPGCLCRIDGTVPGSTNGQNWSQGYATILYREDGFHSIQEFEIENGVSGNWAGIFEGVDYLPMLKEGTASTGIRF